MADIFDYLKWRGDILFSQLPPNPVDALIFSALSYIRFQDVVPETPWQWISLAQAAQEFFAKEDKDDRIRVKQDLELLRQAARSPRFGSVGVSFYADELIAEEESQFSAVTFYLDDGSAFLAFRGTDSTLIGWKEDFNMSFRRTIPAQNKALQYLNTFAAAQDRPIRLGGHSKGGNLAVYAAAKCEPAVQGRILEVYNQDGPGFTDYMMGDAGYLAMVPKIRTYIPQSSVIGMLLEHEEPYQIIRSRQVGILQHELYSWEVMGGDFIHLEQRTSDSMFLDRTIKLWLSGMSTQERNALVDTVFDLLETGNVSQTNQIIQPKNIRAYLKNLNGDPQARNLLAQELVNLIRSVRRSDETKKLEERP